MRYSVLSALAAALLWVALTLLALPVGQAAAEPASAQAPGPETEANEPALDPAAAVFADAVFDTNCQLAVLTQDGVRTMDLQHYLTGVLLAEMPVSFGEEALKAQAVACRTYTLGRCQNSRHPEAAVCTDPHCCQGWTDPAEADPDARELAEAAVKATDGLVLQYDGTLIDATFFSCSGGRTEDAAAVWGSDLPYLRAVASPGEEDAAHFTDELQLPLEDFCAALEGLDDKIHFSDDPGTWLESVQYTAGGGVGQAVLCGHSFSGTALRKAFGLRSTAFSLSLDGGGAIFTTRGNGHRVGMSQYGAAAMAQAGNDFETILKWYYQGVDLAQAELPCASSLAGISCPDGA
ncbi:MAG: stage II sporulation protein D [Oscillospiraceae bacterium]|nr:stage II sporulation protein D [Oscillospiraceae bacterium]